MSANFTNCVNILFKITFQISKLVQGSLKRKMKMMGEHVLAII